LQVITYILNANFDHHQKKKENCWQNKKTRVARFWWWQLQGTSSK